MKWWDSVHHTGGNARHQVSGNAQQQAKSGFSLWQFTKSAYDSFTYMLTHPISDLENEAAILAGLFTGNHDAAWNALYRLIGWNQQNVITPQLSPIRFIIIRIQATIRSAITGLRNWVTGQLRGLRAWVMHLIRHERQARRRADARVEHLARQLARHALATVQREAASAYKAASPAHTNTIERLAADLVAREPLIKGLVGRLVSGAVDLAEIDDPLLRIALPFVMKEVINRLGIEKPAGELLDGLLSSILGQGPPKNLHAVILAICDRLTAVEGQWATFMSDGGPEILQAGEEWAKITSLTADAGLLAFFGSMVADPTAWARDVSDVAGPLVGGAIDGISHTMTVWR